MRKFSNFATNYFYSDYFLGKENSEATFVHYPSEKWFKVNDENHTVGNLVQHYLRDMFLADRNTPDNLLSIASYRMPHPTIEEIEFILVPNNDVNIRC